MMSNTAEVEADICCANCGAAEVDDIKLEECDGCDLVKYCSDKCREEHREEHSEECKNRKAELHDRKLMQQPDETHRGECPLCFLPMPNDHVRSLFYPCCSNYICIGCIFANHISNGDDNCPFCREPVMQDDVGANDRRIMKRVKANDPAALSAMGGKHHDEGNHVGAFDYFKKGAALGDVEAHHSLGIMYDKGQGVEKDEEKAVYHFEIAAIGGHPAARYNLAVMEARNGNMERAVKHHIIAAKLGDEKSMKALWKHYSAGNITKEDLDDTLRAHQAAIIETKSKQRDVGGAYFRSRIRS